jgi:hypothetical protein
MPLDALQLGLAAFQQQCLALVLVLLTVLSLRNICRAASRVSDEP